MIIMEWAESHAPADFYQIFNRILPCLFDYFGSDSLILLLRSLDDDPNLSLDLTDLLLDFGDIGSYQLSFDIGMILIRRLTMRLFGRFPIPWGCKVEPLSSLLIVSSHFYPGIIEV